MAKPKSKAKQKLGTREENIEELKRLQEMYRTLPPGKKKAMQKPLQDRMKILQDAIDGPKSSGAFVSFLQTVITVILIVLVALGLGFFGISYLVRAG